MRQFDLQSVVRRKTNYRVSIKKGMLADGTVLENKLNRDFDKSVPLQDFVTDVTYIATKEGWLYVSPVMDLCTREIVVCEMSLTQNLDLAFATIDKLAEIGTDSIQLHSDQGVLYTSHQFRSRAQKYGIDLSYSRRGNCWDNAVMENWNGMLKTEWMYHPELRRDKQLISADQAKREILEYCTYWNEVRIQERLKYRSPKEFREAVSRQFAD